MCKHGDLLYFCDFDPPCSFCSEPVHCDICGRPCAEELLEEVMDRTDGNILSVCPQCM